MEKKLKAIRRDLDLVLPKSGYRLDWRAGKTLRVSLDQRVHENTRRFSEALIKQHDVPFEIERH